MFCDGVEMMSHIFRIGDRSVRMKNNNSIVFDPYVNKWLQQKTHFLTVQQRIKVYKVVLKRLRFLRMRTVVSFFRWPFTRRCGIPPDAREFQSRTNTAAFL